MVLGNKKIKHPSLQWVEIVREPVSSKYAAAFWVLNSLEKKKTSHHALVLPRLGGISVTFRGKYWTIGCSGKSFISCAAACRPR